MEVSMRHIGVLTLATATAIVLWTARGSAQSGVQATVASIVERKLEARPEAKVTTEDEDTLTNQGYVAIGTISASQPGKKPNTEATNVLQAAILKKAAEFGGDVVRFSAAGEVKTRDVPDGTLKTRQCTESHEWREEVVQQAAGIVATEQIHTICDKWEQKTETKYKKVTLLASEGMIWRLDPKLLVEMDATRSLDEAAANGEKEAAERLSRGSSTGSGFFITDDGYLISSYHIVKDAGRVTVLTNGQIIDAKVVKVDAASDMALLKAEGTFAVLPVISSLAVKTGAKVATIGFTGLGLQASVPKLTKAEIASLSGAKDDPRYFQISDPLQPGNCGGALIDEFGNVVGIISSSPGALWAVGARSALSKNVNYAAKSSLLLSFLESVPGVLAKLKSPNTNEQKFENVLKSAQAAAAMVWVN